MVTLDLVLAFLASNRIRATYGAVAEAIGRPEAFRALRNEPQFLDHDPRTAWVVLAKTRQPPEGKHLPRPNDSELIRDGAVLAQRVAAEERL